MKRTYRKYLFILLLIVTTTIAYVYAQQNYFSKKAVSESNLPDKEVEEHAENIGELTEDDPWKEMDNLINAYYNKKGAAFNGRIKLIDDNGAQEKVIEEHEFEYSVFKSSFYYKLDKIEVASNNNLLVLADHSNNIISVSSQSTDVSTSKKIFDIGDFKKMMKERKAEAKITQLGDEKILTVENIADPQIQGYRIYYNPESYVISKMLIGMVRLSPLSDDEGGIDDQGAGNKMKIDEKIEGENEEAIETYTYYMEIIYDKMKILNTDVESYSPEKKFIIGGKENIGLSAAYKNYRFVVNGNIINEIKEEGEGK